MFEKLPIILSIMTNSFNTYYAQNCVDIIYLSLPIVPLQPPLPALTHHLYQLLCQVPVQLLVSGEK